MSLFEKAIETLSPKWAKQRATNKVLLSHIRKYEAASKSPRTGGWVAHGTSANAEIATSLTEVRNRSRQLVRDNPFANRALQVITSSVIGYGIMTTTESKRLNTLYKEWAESKECDFDGKCNMYGLQEQAMNCVIEAGEVLIRRHWVRGAKVPLKLQLLEPDYIDDSKNTWLADGKRIVMGVQFNKEGKKEGYWIYKNHPNDYSFGYGTTLQSEFVPASEIVHVYRQDRIGQVRGMPWGSSVMLRLHDIDEYEDFHLIRQKVAACYGVFIHDADHDDPQVSGKYEIPERLDPSAINLLPAGKSVSTSNPPSLNGYSEYMSAMLHSVAVGFGITYESLTGDYSQVNFSSGRMGRIDFHANLDKWQWNMFIPQFCDGVWDWFKSAAVLAGVPSDNAKVKHTPPKRVMVDPTREIPSLIKGIRAGITTLPAVLREAGESPDLVLEEIAKTNDMLDKLGIKLDCDPRHVTQQGQNQIEPKQE
jgi:lambda family phage portal protein